MAMTQGLDAWLFADMPGMRTIRVSEDGGTTWGELTLSSSMTTEDALAEWQAQYAAWSPGRFECLFEYYPAADQVSIEPETTIDLEFESASLATHLGFSSASQPAIFLSVVSDLPPAGLHYARVGRGARQPRETVQRRGGRIGPQWAEAWSHGSTMEARLTMTAADYDARSIGPLLSGRLTVHEPGGADVVGDVLAAKAEPLGQGPSHWRITLTLGVR